MVERKLQQSHQLSISKHLATLGRKKSFSARRNLRQNQAAIRHNWLGIRGGRQDKRHAVEECQRLIITDD